MCRLCGALHLPRVTLSSEAGSPVPNPPPPAHSCPYSATFREPGHTHSHPEGHARACHPTPASPELGLSSNSEISSLAPGASQILMLRPCPTPTGQTLGVGPSGCRWAGRLRTGAQTPSATVLTHRAARDAPQDKARHTCHRPLWSCPRLNSMLSRQISTISHYVATRL